MSMEEVQENFKKLTLEGSRVIEANEEVEAAYMAERNTATTEDSTQSPPLSQMQRWKHMNLCCSAYQAKRL